MGELSLQVAGASVALSRLAPTLFGFVMPDGAPGLVSVELTSSLGVSSLELKRLLASATPTIDEADDIIAAHFARIRSEITLAEDFDVTRLVLDNITSAIDGVAALPPAKRISLAALIQRNLETPAPAPALQLSRARIFGSSCLAKKVDDRFPCLRKETFIRLAQALAVAVISVEVPVVGVVFLGYQLYKIADGFALDVKSPFQAVASDFEMHLDALDVGGAPPPALNRSFAVNLGEEVAQRVASSSSYTLTTGSSFVSLWDAETGADASSVVELIALVKKAGDVYQQLARALKLSKQAAFLDVPGDFETGLVDVSHITVELGAGADSTKVQLIQSTTAGQLRVTLKNLTSAEVEVPLRVRYENQGVRAFEESFPVILEPRLAEYWEGELDLQNVGPCTVINAQTCSVVGRASITGQSFGAKRKIQFATNVEANNFRRQTIFGGAAGYYEGCEGHTIPVDLNTGFSLQGRTQGVDFDLQFVVGSTTTDTLVGTFSGVSKPVEENIAVSGIWSVKRKAGVLFPKCLQETGGNDCRTTAFDPPPVCYSQCVDSPNSDECAWTAN